MIKIVRIKIPFEAMSPHEISRTENSIARSLSPTSYFEKAREEKPSTPRNSTGTVEYLRSPVRGESPPCWRQRKYPRRYCRRAAVTRRSEGVRGRPVYVHRWMPLCARVRVSLDAAKGR